MSTPTKEKKQLRATYKALRAKITGERKTAFDNAICERIISLSSFRFADTVLTYAPIGSEVGVDRIALRALELGKKVAYPVCDTDTREMTFKYIGSLDELISGAYSIPEPSMDAECYSSAQHPICIVPALSFDTHGFRLGYGGGYYDKFLKKFSGVVLGVCYESLIADALPTGIYDAPVDIIITEERSIIPNAKG